ncbi:RNA 2',3'-cyclic phosphodiesterase [Agrobacterium tumefaciens]|uniref:RNA 2',3'-cyclic phosphodiesterase n=1 Tax=Agrobacterium tumefaciens TaxID=358 RepID=A0AA44JBI8_AGRTU|nr:RNA 2',3'-cyclic phosphodiesterase [Agrobacterium tumefaciens]NSL20429.1 RNA 2',3'-cyclic phosphodiesterase [Agrobacterium tumefaciens]NTB89502.1 RNA 2',3'-cyclic phosphodiesterase [Agrobacterium tumefaciens]NTC19380.1 RNA 2',3'-cyclic phosphodiesterase [Agrobacterium tumefaciens]NTC31856.1 RNA 2',3'-cyclic phosphodiesterase [Agrobacterium tumefaciens]NTC58552.1 RNA 2',3'-cyclic phosphodiesterase [Agrobacterium tumefaciens]
MPRLFIALEIPRNAAMSLSLLRGGLPGARWIDVENYHITLRFIGDIDGRTADEVVDRLDRIDRPEFQLSLNGMGSFGSKKPHSIWAGVSPSPEMNALQAEVERICQRIGLPPDPRKFMPHVTLARLRSSRLDDVVQYLSGRGNFRTSAFTVGRFVLMSSKESVGGGPYIVEEVFPLHEAWSSAIFSSNELHPAKSML